MLSQIRAVDPWFAEDSGVVVDFFDEGGVSGMPDDSLEAL